MTTKIFDNIPADWYQQPLTENPAVNAVIALSLRYPTYWTLGYSWFSLPMEILKARQSLETVLVDEKMQCFLTCSNIYRQKSAEFFRSGSWNCTQMAISALIAYDHSDHYLTMPEDELRTWIRISEDPAAILIEPVRKPMALSLNRIKVLNNG